MKITAVLRTHSRKDFFKRMLNDYPEIKIK